LYKNRVWIKNKITAAKMENMLSVITRIKSFLDKLISYDGIDRETLQFKKTYLSFVFVVSADIVAMTFMVDYYNVPTLFLFGILLLSWYIPFMILFVTIKGKLEWLVHISQHMVLFITLFCLVKIGGILNSGGMFLSGLCTVMFTVVFYSIPWSVWYFGLYFIGIIAAHIIQLKLKIPPEMSSDTNSFLTFVNTLFISGLTLAVVLVYLFQYTRMEKEKADRLKELNEIKSKFYTNITHEFRTPITVILGAADQIEGKTNKLQIGLLEKIRQNGRILLSLVNQMLNLSKLEAGVMPVNYVQGDVIRYIRYVSESFEFLSKNKKLSFVFNSGTSSFVMDYDPEKVLQILSNLLGNSIKYTPKGGSIELSLSIIKKTKMLEITISDSGPGIPPDKIKHVFDRFYKVSNNAEPGSSGLGLSITKELVQLLKGEITMESKIGLGTTVKVVLPITKTAPLETLPEQKWVMEYIPLKNRDVKTLPYKSTSDRNSTVLIVEDNLDVTDYINSLLENQYQIISAINGKEGLSKAIETIPDIIISDIMMPEMDGIELLQQLKTDIRTSHIPVIMLTAKSDMESKIEGITLGAEAYLSKPFNKDELFARLASLIKLRKELQKKYSNPVLQLDKKGRQSNIEDSFIQRVCDFFNLNIDNEELAVSDICEAMNMSRSQLYRKFGALTNRTIGDYLRTFRLQRAKELLQKSDLNVTQVAFEVGFKNLSHFSKSFYAEFGISPSQLKK
jgi:signal transduction histidine kinase/DNA-binding response OmpR family regulator